MLQDELAAKLGVTKGTLSKYKARGCPIEDEGRARCWIKANIRPRTKQTGEIPLDIPPAELPAPALDHSWEARLERARRMEIAIYEATKLAIGRKEHGQLTSLLGSYQRSLQGIADAEQTATETRIQSGELLHRETARAILAELVVPIRNALDLLPITERSRCNPTQPEVAQAALTAWKDSLLHKLSQAETKF